MPFKRRYQVQTLGYAWMMRPPLTKWWARNKFFSLKRAKRAAAKITAHYLEPDMARVVDLTKASATVFVSIAVTTTYKEGASEYFTDDAWKIWTWVLGTRWPCHD